MKIDAKSDFTQADVDRLVYLYSQAMEFYEEKNVYKYASFKERIQKLLEVKTRDRCLTEDRRTSSLIKIDRNAPKCQFGPSKGMSSMILMKGSDTPANKKLDMSMRVLETIEKSEEEKVKIIDNYNQICKKKSYIVQDDISAQKSNLQKRLAMRKNKGFSQTFTVSKESGGMNKTAIIEDFSGLDSEHIPISLNIQGNSYWRK